MNSRKTERNFAIFAGAALIATALAKTVSGFEHPDLGSKRDVVFHFLTVKQLLGVTAALELLVGWMCLSPKVPRYVAWLSLFWLATCFGLYRLGPFLITGRWRSTCNCLGEVSLMANRQVVDTLLLLVLGALLSGSFFFALRAATVREA